MVGEFSTYDDELSEEKNTSKILRPLQPYFASLAMLSSLEELKFEIIVSAVQAELARRSNTINPQIGNSITQEPKENIANGSC